MLSWTDHKSHWQLDPLCLYSMLPTTVAPSEGRPLGNPIREVNELQYSKLRRKLPTHAGE
jgi:hypothetical protein